MARRAYTIRPGDRVAVGHLAQKEMGSEAEGRESPILPSPRGRLEDGPGESSDMLKPDAMNCIARR
jgi:hypothetical protein